MLPAVAATRNERNDERLLLEIAREYARTYQRRSAAPLIGGTALKVVLGIDRPTTDLDFARSSPRRNIARDEVAPIMERLTKRKIEAKTEDNNHRTWLTGRRRWWQGAIELKVDEVQALPEHAGRETTIRGIRTYDERTLVALKIRTVRPGRASVGRAKGRDLYDCAWIAQNRPELITDEDLEILKELTELEPTNERVRRWKEDFKTDPVMRRISMQTVLECLREAVLHEHKERSARKRESQAPSRAGAEAAGKTLISRTRESSQSARERGNTGKTDKGHGR